ncbi:amino acid adenylation domain-containing protein [Streptomyces sp. NPDC050703]|uniref:amino acid adenylation domain-containing protein n=1 Tax=Streptomyces sp. NPDC050703 TaxID=3157218 RepID=UPI003447DD00
MTGQVTPAKGRARISEVLPLSPLQEGLLFLTGQATGQATAHAAGPDPYTLQFTADIEGGDAGGAEGGDVAGRLRAAATVLLTRHPNLRACFRNRKNGEPVQLVLHADDVPLPWSERDLTHLTGDALEAEAGRIAAEDRLRGFDPAKPPLMRFTLLRLGGGRHRLLWSVHHILMDGWSLPLAVRELLELAAAGGADRLPAPAPYRSFLGWLGGRDREAARRAWARTLSGVEDPVHLVPPSPAGTARALPLDLRRTLGADRTAALTAWCRTAGVTLSSVVQGCWAVLLGRLTGRQDVVFGAVTSGRPAEVPGVESMIGLFANTLPVRADVRPGLRASELFRALAAQRLEMMPHEHLPLAEAQAACGVRGELFDTVLAFQNYPLDEENLLRGGGTGVSGARAHTATHYPLGLTVHPGDVIDVRLSYAPDRVAADRAADILGRLIGVLAAVADDPEVLLARLGGIAEAERRRILDEWSGGTAEPGAGATIPELFAARAARTPDATALTVPADGTAARVELSYRELDARANRLAHHLVEHGAGPETFVALALPRGADLVVAVLAVLKAGAAYLPVDPSYPADRIAHTLADARPPLVLTTSGAGLPEVPGARAVHLDSAAVRDAVAARPATAPRTRVRPEHPAYVIYTSGSTGRPKGVVVPHANVARLLGATDAWFGFGGDDVWTLFHSIAFDFTVWELWGALLYGGRLVVVPYDVSRSPDAFLRLLASERVTVLNQTPSAFYQLMRADAEHRPELALRYVVFGGEALDIGRLTGWYERHADDAPRLVNMYGITETTVHVSHQELDAARAEAGEGSTIGRGIPDLRVYLLDGALQPVPAGVRGELYVAGPGLARGYLNRPALTSGRFVACPFGGPGARMYRTGDLARWRADGTLEYLGRADQQVQLRGFRVEPGEIGTVLERHPAVAQAAVVVREDREGDQRLVAYVVPTGQGADADALRAFAGERLPGHMVPSAVVPLDALPLTANGKLDRAALPAPTYATTDRAPRTADERLLCGVFAEVLGLERVGVDDDFFALGGHSLLATRIVNRARAELGADLGVRDLFEAPSVARLAARVDERRAEAGQRAEGERGRPELVPVRRPDVVPLSYAQQRLWFIERLGAPAGLYNIPLAVRLTGHLDAGALTAALRDVVARHEALRTVFPATAGTTETSGGGFTPGRAAGAEEGATPPGAASRGVGRAGQQVLAPADAPVHLPVTEIAGAALDAALAAEAARGFDLEHQPPLRARLFATGPDEHVLLIVVHHIAADGWSLAPLARDLTEAYAARRAGAAPAWAPLPVQYADYTLWQRRLLGDESDPRGELSRQLAHWRTALAGLPDELDLPFDRPRGARADHRGGSVRMAVPAEVAAGLRAAAREWGVSVFMLLQAGLAATLTRLGAGTDIPLGSPVAGRSDERLADLVGVFVNTLVLRTDTSGDPAFRTLVERVKVYDLAAYQHQDVPFEKLVEALNPERSRARHPLFQVMLGLENADRSATVTVDPELSMDVVPVAGATAKWDLFFQLTEDAGDEGRIGLAVEYSASLFEESTARRIADAYLRLLAGALADPARPLSGLDILPARERAALLALGTNDAPAPAGTVTAAFARQARATPDAVALLHGEGGALTLTYGALDARANRLAQHLIAAHGVRRGDVVALRLERGPLTVVTLLAIARTGAAYLPLDPQHPADRVRAMLTDSGARLLLTEESAGDAAYDGVRTVVLDASATRAAVEAAPATAPDVRLAPDDLLYVIYTSGSTGRPKGVAVSHRAALRLVHGLTHLGVGGDDTFVYFAPVAFDASTFEIWAPLLHGARLAVTPAGPAEPTAIGAFLRATGVSVAFFTTQLVNVLADTAPDALATLRLLLTGGEAHSVDHIARLRAALPGLTLVNIYGPTEVTTFALSHTVADDPSGASNIPVGLPIGGTRCYVLDAALRPVPRGVVGELYLAGAGLARGYLGRPGPTAERFVADPYGPAGTRMYRTGDLVRWNTAGLIEYVGRDDHQVKVRGYRIELTEIERALTAHPAVARAAVLAPRTATGRELVAYVVPASPGARPEAERLRAHLGRTLPGYMVPAAYAFLGELPLTVNGKLDTRALPAPGTVDRPASRTARAPRDAAERALAEAVREVLGTADVGLDDGFFALGGDSLKAIRLVNAAARRGLRLSLGDVFEHRTVEALAAAGGTAGDGLDTLAPVLPIRAGGTLPPLFCVHGGLGFAVPFAALAEHLDPRRPVIGLQARGIAAAEPLPAGLTEVADDYVRKIRAVQPHGPYHLLGWSYGGVVAHEMAVRLREAGEDVAYLANLDAYPDDARGARPDDAEFLAEFLTEAGVDAGALTELTPRTVTALLRSDPGSPLAAFDVATLERLLKVMRNNLNLFRRFTPGVLDGPMTLFVAAEGLDADERGLKAKSWEPHLTGAAGRLRTHDVPCGHQDMMRPAPAAHIGRRVEEALAALDRARTTTHTH